MFFSPLAIGFPRSFREGFFNREPLIGGKLPGPGPDENQMGRMIQNCTGNLDGMAVTLQRAHGTTLKGLAVLNRSIQFDDTGTIR